MPLSRLIREVTKVIAAAPMPQILVTWQRISALAQTPMKLVAKIIQYCREGKTLPLVIGDKAYGKYRWTIVSHDIELTTTDGNGNVTSMTVSITLQEYLRK